MDKCMSFEYRVLRHCTGLSSNWKTKKWDRNAKVYWRAKTEPIREYILNITDRFFNKLENHPNPKIRRLYEQGITIPLPTFLRPCQILNSDLKIIMLSLWHNCEQSSPDYPLQHFAHGVLKTSGCLRAWFTWKSTSPVSMVKTSPRISTVRATQWTFPTGPYWPTEFFIRNSIRPA